MKDLIISRALGDKSHPPIIEDPDFTADDADEDSVAEENEGDTVKSEEETQKATNNDAESPDSGLPNIDSLSMEEKDTEGKGENGELGAAGNDDVNSESVVNEDGDDAAAGDAEEGAAAAVSEEDEEEDDGRSEQGDCYVQCITCIRTDAQHWTYSQYNMTLIIV